VNLPTVADSPPCALVICTIARPIELGQSLSGLNRQSLKPQFVVIVDASPNDEIAKAIEFSRNSTELELVHLRSTPGLAHQRNVGLNYARTRLPLRSIVHFIDDDAIPMPSYLESIHDVFGLHEDAICVGGRDTERVVDPAPLIARLIGTNSRKEGRILRTAWNIHSRSRTEIREVDWVSGLSQSYNIQRLGGTQFDDTIRFYGEEVDMHVRCASLGRIFRTPFAEIHHLESTVGREDETEVTLWTDCSKWMLCVNYPERFSKSIFLGSTIAHMFLKLLSGSLRARSKDRLTAYGHARFIGRLLRGRHMREPF
jgi:GT2 family glycosyltransferase